MLDTDTAKLFFQLGTYGPLGIMVILLFILLLRQQKETKDTRVELISALKEEREKNERLLMAEQEKNERIYNKSVELGMESIRSEQDSAEAVRHMARVVESVDRRLS